MGSQRVNTTARLSLSIAAHTGENTEKKQREEKKKKKKHTGPKSKPKKQISPDQRELCVPHEG